MRKIIWTCWFQGWEEAPPLVQKCLKSWKNQNSAWDFRFLDVGTISRYIDLASHIDLTRQPVTTASLSGVVRMLLLHEYGGVWVDATTLCNIPLDDWIHLAADGGFFAFTPKEGEDTLATWFLAARPGNYLVANWAARLIQSWGGRPRTNEHSWLLSQFVELCKTNTLAFRAWQDIPRISAEGPMAIQTLGLYKDFDDVKSSIDWTVPLFKLTHRLDVNQIASNSAIARLLDLPELQSEAAPPVAKKARKPERPIGLLKVTDKNLGDHIQTIATETLLRRAGFIPSFRVDRDDGISDPPPLPSEPSPGIVLHGWHKKNPSKWPPDPAYRALYLGFHIAHEHTPSLIAPAALEHYASHGPIGCRDRRTLALLRSHGLEAFLSNCLSVTFPRRLPDADHQTEVFVSSHDRQILDYLPSSIGPFTFVCHYSDSDDYIENARRATQLLDAYRHRARLVVTNLLHCALPAIAMGVPVVVFYPPDEWSHHESHLARFSSLSELVRVFQPSEASFANWLGYTPDVSTLKLKLLDAFCTMAAARWGPLPPAPPEQAVFATDEVPDTVATAC
jgi:hypothetical protein